MKPFLSHCLAAVCMSVFMVPAFATTYTLTATTNFSDASTNAIAGLGTAATTLIPDGSPLTYVFDFNPAIDDVNLDPVTGEYPGAITGLSLTIGSYDFSDSSSCSNPIDCQVRVVSQSLFGTYRLSSDLRQSGQLGIDISNLMALDPPVFGSPTVASSIVLQGSQLGPFSGGDALLPPDQLDLTGSLSLIPGPLSVFSTDSSFSKLSFTLSDVTVIEGLPSPVPLPAAGWLFSAALGLLAVARRRG